MSVSINLIDSHEVGILSIKHLKRYWHKHCLIRSGQVQQKNLPEEWNTDIAMIAALSLGLEQITKYLYSENPSFETFENWVLDVNNQILNISKIEQFNLFIDSMSIKKIDAVESEKIFSEEEINFWNENGYLILRNAISKDDCENTIAAICDFIEIDRYDKATWYNPHPARQGIMVQLFQHPILEKNRNSPLIRRAYEQLWQRKDIWVNTDRVGFNPPETETWKFPGPRLHWDVSLKMPIPFGLQGILYLADTAYNQGAFSLVPGFHNKIENWLNNLPANAHPRHEDIYSLGVVPIVANAGDFIIWHHALPHGSSANSSTQPRFVQYLNYEPLDAFQQDEWI
jgi:ectoine hydroxylase-related dioxygenase (phytanoyl-CoA dioxygenase family)